MNTEEARELAEAHWEYTERIILLMLELTKYSYIEAMVHGAKHDKETNQPDSQKGGMKDDINRTD